jgi:carbon storage regulator CsrA
MLVLSRKQNQQIVIDGKITITVLKIRGNTVRIGIEAPDDVPVRRGELAAQKTPSPGIIEFRNKRASGDLGLQLRVSAMEVENSRSEI